MSWRQDDAATIQFCKLNVMDYSMFLCRGEPPEGLRWGQKHFGLHELHAMASEKGDEYYYFAIIDISQEYSSKKAWAHFAKVSVLCKGEDQVSSCPTGDYGKRFVERMHDSIQSEPKMEDDHKFMQEHHEFDWKQYDARSCCCPCAPRCPISTNRSPKSDILI
jgi:hypothetical protein